MTVYEINQQILDCIDEDGEIIDIERYDALQLSVEKKISELIAVYKNLNYTAEALKTEAGNLNRRYYQTVSTAEKIKQFLAVQLNGQKYENERHKIFWRQSTAVEISDPFLIPDHYLRETPADFEPDKDMIKQALKNGETIPGATLVVRNNIQIK